MSDSERRAEDATDSQPGGFQHRRLGIAIHILVILGSAFVALTTDDSLMRVANIAVCAVAVLSVIVLAVNPAGRRSRSQG
jgi:hypothetical protein